jgi:DNA-binding MarR family transcriptional regulator
LNPANPALPCVLSAHVWAVLAVLDHNRSREMSFGDIAKEGRLLPGTAHPILVRLRNAGWLLDRYESDGRTRRRYWWLHPDHVDAVHALVMSGWKQYRRLGIGLEWTRPPFRVTPQLCAVLAVLVEDPTRERYGRDIVNAIGLWPGSLRPIVERLRAAGWLTDRREDEETAVVEGRPARRYWRLHPDKVDAARALIASRADQYGSLTHGTADSTLGEQEPARDDVHSGESPG